MRFTHNGGLSHKQTICNNRGAAIAQRFVYAYHPATQGSSPKHTIYTFINYSQICAIFVM